MDDVKPPITVICLNESFYYITSVLVDGELDSYYSLNHRSRGHHARRSPSVVQKHKIVAHNCSNRSVVKAKAFDVDDDDDGNNETCRHRR